MKGTAKNHPVKLYAKHKVLARAFPAKRASCLRGAFLKKYCVGDSVFLMTGIAELKQTVIWELQCILKGLHVLGGMQILARSPKILYFSYIYIFLLYGFLGDEYQII